MRDDAASQASHRSALDHLLARSMRLHGLAEAVQEHEIRRGDFLLNPTFPNVRPVTPRDAAVLIPVVARPEPGVLFTLRTSTLGRYAGQVSFPGGKIDPEDAGPAAAALREAEEEIGLAPDCVRPLGYLDAYVTTSGFRIFPLVGIVPPDAPVTANEAEVEEIFEVPLSFLVNPQSHRTQAVMREGHRRVFYDMTFDRYRIWGVTAGIVRGFYEQVYL